MRNGVIAIHRNGTLALMNDEAYRIFALTRADADVGRPFAEVRPGFETAELQPGRLIRAFKDLDEAAAAFDSALAKITA